MQIVALVPELGLILSTGLTGQGSLVLRGLAGFHHIMRAVIQKVVSASVTGYFQITGL